MYRITLEKVEKWKNDRNIHKLIKALKCNNTGIREAAVEALGYLCDPRAVEPLEQILQHDTEKVQNVAAKALRRIGGEKAKGALFCALLTNNYRSVRRAAAWALGRRYLRVFLDITEGVPRHYTEEEDITAKRMLLNLAQAFIDIEEPEASRFLVSCIKYDHRTGIGIGGDLCKLLCVTGNTKALIEVFNDDHLARDVREIAILEVIRVDEPVSSGGEAVYCDHQLVPTVALLAIFCVFAVFFIHICPMLL